MADFLFEIGLEEVPARMIAGAQEELGRRVTSMLRKNNLMSSQDEKQVRTFATPRRLAVHVPEVFERQSDSDFKVRGPAAKIAFKDGKPTPVAEAFARKNGVVTADLKIEATETGDYVFAETTIKGRVASEVIAAEMAKELAEIYWAKNMRWMVGRQDRFVRPVRWIVALLGGAVVPVEFGGKTADAVTYGHRVLFGEQPVKIGAAKDYESALTSAKVVADVEVRRERIRKALDKATRTVAGARWREDEALVETVTQLTEWPSVILGSFEKDYLTLPDEVLVTVMRDHQKYFAVEMQGKGNREQGTADSTHENMDGRLAPYFLAVLNTETDAAGEAVIRHGNERVLRARFNDARFFWEFDQRVKLADRVGLLEKVTFQKDLGSYGKKSERVQRLAAALGALVAERGVKVDAAALDEAVRLAKTDLTTELVKEFTELQGVVGGLYAKAQGASQVVADAIYDQYRPAGIEGSVPRSTEGVLLGIADRADTIAGMFGLGLEPTGSKDPFALRRAANGIVKMLAESGLPLKLSEVAEIAAMAKEEVAGNMVGFFAERVEFYLREARGQAYDVVKAVLAAGGDDVRDAVARAEALTAVRGSGDFAAVSAAFKRMKNILAQAKEKGIAPAMEVQQALLNDPGEWQLTKQSGELAGRVEGFRSKKDYCGALEQIATLREAVDGFFDTVMVMAPEEDVRANRLALLERVLRDFSGIADFSEIVTAG